ncbi:MAG: hypothetical protein A3G38_00660 [Omnitrophica WOR_2 bacterium RIFCSPLOWO2_12_FULL_51_8]|nr:MAG: hypothetical protein A3G38_00660 [Omnitrophica WOR_2 bacterium RIFCSPLOWO2_12_FULL_51_8]
MFIDQAKISVKGGHGGRGAKSFYRDKFTRRGIADGGGGGPGADIVIRADRNLCTLLDFKYNRHFVGAHGSGKNKKGRAAPNVVIRVPCGTIVEDLGTKCRLRDLKADGEEFIAARGGKGGVGNQKLRQASEGGPGEERELLLDLKLIADAAVVGFPNVGKSTLVSAVSGAHPKIAGYPFTTTTCILGVVRFGDKSFTIADIPGLIKGSAKGRGLGDRFLRHIERAKILVHLLDISASEGRGPWEDYRALNQELKDYSPEVYRKPQIIAANKMDLEGAKENLLRFSRQVRKKVYSLSALKKEGLEELIEAIAERV